ncbi:MAG: hypothetical protein WBA54_00445 [Acidaminobacteraceae bacterium]
MNTIYYLTIFAILSDIQFGSTRYQDIDKKFLREFEKYDQALDSLQSVKNLNLMRNFPFAAIEYIVEEKREHMISEQYIFKLDEISNIYDEFENSKCFPLATLTQINPFKYAEYRVKT